MFPDSVGILGMLTATGPTELNSVSIVFPRVSTFLKPIVVEPPLYSVPRWPNLAREFRDVINVFE